MKFYVCADSDRLKTDKWTKHDSLGTAAHDARSMLKSTGATQVIFQGETVGEAKEVGEVVRVVEIVFRLTAPKPGKKGKRA